MPTNTQRFLGAIASIGITVGGAWLASMAHSNSTSVAQVAFPNGVSATFTNIRNANGKVVVMVFADREAFKTYDVTKAVGYAEVPAQPGDVTAVFPHLSEGPYAIAGFHDEDENQDLNLDGDWPTEGYATNGALDAYDLPTFRRAVLRKSKVSIVMYYSN